MTNPAQRAHVFLLSSLALQSALILFASLSAHDVSVISNADGTDTITLTEAQDSAGNFVRLNAVITP
jgi:hypothetical protein